MAIFYSFMGILWLFKAMKVTHAENERKSLASLRLLLLAVFGVLLSMSKINLELFGRTSCQ